MRKWAKWSGSGLLGMILVLAAYIIFQIQIGNFHTIVAGEAYRSAQPTRNDLERYSKLYGIKSVINLRGWNPNDSWYNEEVAASMVLGITHIDFRMKAARELTNEQALELIKVMRDAPKPVLIHCNAGADRSGLASALYVAGVAGGSEWEADYQLSLRYGHVPLWFRESAAMRRTFERMEPVFGYKGT